VATPSRGQSFIDYSLDPYEPLAHPGHHIAQSGDVGVLPFCNPFEPFKMRLHQNDILECVPNVPKQAH
jgi:hypothetical protein